MGQKHSQLKFNLERMELQTERMIGRTRRGDYSSRMSQRMIKKKDCYILQLVKYIYTDTVKQRLLNIVKKCLINSFVSLNIGPHWFLCDNDYTVCGFSLKMYTSGK